MDMTAAEVKGYWRDFCERHGLGADLIAKGEAKIDTDPEQWADRTMPELLEAIGGRLDK